MSIPRYFNLVKIRTLSIYACGIFSVLTFILWVTQYYVHLRIDWSFLLPTITLISALLPIGNAVIDWFEKKTNAIEEQLNRLEVSELSFKESIKNSDCDRHDLRGRLLRVEILLESLLTKE